MLTTRDKRALFYYTNISLQDGLESLLAYFKSTFVSGSLRRSQPPSFPDGTITPLRMRRVPPLYPPTLWNVDEVTRNGESR